LARHINFRRRRRRRVPKISKSAAAKSMDDNLPAAAV